MMEALLSSGVINDKGTFKVQLSGGSPWGFTIHGGREFGTKLCISKITPGGKASNTKVLQVGDEILLINNMECSTRAEAIEQVRCSRQKLRLTVKRNEDKGQESTRKNGIQEIRSTDHHPLPNLYKTALEVSVEPNDFYSTYSIDPDIYARISQKSKEKKSNMGKSYDDLSASNEDLLNQYRKGGTQGSEDELENIEKPSFSNGRLSPNKELSGHSFPESQLHGRTLMSPGRIQKVKITSANISSSSSTFSSPDDEGTRHQSRISPVKHSPIARQHHVSETEAASERDNWFEKWLRDDKSSATTDKNISLKDACSKYEQENLQEQQTPPQSPVENRSNFSRSKSFSGRPSYGVVFGTTAVKSDDHSEITAYQAPLPPTRYSSSDLLRDKPRQNNTVDNWQPVEVDTSPRKVTTIQEEKKYGPIDVRRSRKSVGAFPMVSSTSSLDSIGYNDPRRQGPAPPPRRSESKLLSSFRVRGRRSHPQATGGAAREAILKEENRPKHTPSNSWPSDYLGDNVHKRNSPNRQSWHSNESKHYEDSSKASGSRRSTSVVVRSVRTSSSSMDDTTEAKMYRSLSVELKPEITETEAIRPQSAQNRSRPTQPDEQRQREIPQQQLERPQQQHAQQQLYQQQQHNQQQQQPQQQQQRPQQQPEKQQPQQQQQQQQQQQRPQQQPEKQQPQQQQQQQQQQQRPQQQPEKQQPQQQQQQQQQQQRPQQQPEKQQQQQPQQQQQQLQQQPSHLQNESDSLSSRIEDTQILQKLMKDNQVNSHPTVRSRIQSFEKSSSQPNLIEGPDVHQLRPHSYHPKQRSWDNSYSAFNKTFTNAKSELRSAGRFGSSDRIASLEHVEPQQKDPEPSIRPVDKSPVRVTVRELAETAKTVMQSTTKQDLQEDALQRSSPVVTDSVKQAKPVREHVERRESSSIQEKEIYLEEMFKNFGGNDVVGISTNTIEESNNNLTIKTQSHPTAKLSVGDDDVFTTSTLDESLPLPPPPSHSHQETSHDNLPLPTPPREILAEEPVRAVIKQDRNRNTIEVQAVEHVRQETSRDNPGRHSYMENKPKHEEGEEILNEIERNKDTKNIDGRQLQQEKSMNVKNTKNEELCNERRREEKYNYINTEITSSPPLKESSLHESTDTSPSKIELDAANQEETTVTKDPPSPLVFTSTPTRGESIEEGDHGGSPFSGSSLSTPSSSRPGSMMSPKLEALDKEKGELVDSMRKKIEDLRTQMNEIGDEIAENEKLGEKVTDLVEVKAAPSEFSKYQRFTGELNKIVLLLLSLTQRMHRYENTLQELDMSEEADRQQRDILLDKIDHVKGQYQEACKIKEVNDKRGEVVSNFLENYLDEDEFADFEYYIDMKTQLALMHAEIRDKVKMGEERLNTLTATAIDWNMMSFCGYEAQ